MSNDITLKPKMQSNNLEFDKYIEDIEINFKTNKENFVGTFNCWNISLNLNTNNIEIPESIKLNFMINQKNIKMPTFFLTPVSDEETTEDVEIKGYDKSILFDEPFEWTQTLPCTVGELAQNICNKVGVPLKNTNFANSGFIIYRQIADNKRTNREIIAMIAAIAGGNAFINEDDELEIRSFIDIDLDIQEYFLSEKFVKVGPITGINLAREPIKDYKDLNDAALSAQYESLMVKIVNNLIVDDNRELALQAIYDKLHGLEFYCKKIETHEAFFIKPFSFVQCNEHKVLVDTICLKYPTLLDSYISSNQLTKVETTAKNKSLKQRVINAEAKVDEVEGKINLLTSEVSEHDDKISELEVNVDGIKNTVQNTVDVTRKVSGAKSLKLENCMEGELLKLIIHGDNTVFKHTYPSKKLAPSKSLFPGGNSTIIVRSENLKDKFEELFANKYLSIQAIQDADANVIGYKSYTSSSPNNRRCYVMEIEPGKNYKIFLDKNEMSDTKYLHLASFSENPWTSEENLDAIRYLGNRRRIDGTVNTWYTDMSETYIEFTATEEEKYLAFYCYATSTFETAKFYTKYEEIDLGIKYALNQKDDVSDDCILENNHVKVIRRIGTSESGNYILQEPIIEDLGEKKILLDRNTNIVEIKSYTANMEAEFIILNDFTSRFATTVEMKTIVTQLANQFNVTLSHKVGEEELIAAFNMAILREKGENPTYEEIEKSIIQIFANILEIDTDNFRLSKDGTATLIKGIIAGLTMAREGTTSKLFKEIGNYQSGLNIPDSNADTPFLFAGYDKNKGGSLFNSNVYITHLGKMFAKWFEVNGEDGYFIVKYNSGKTAMLFNKNGIGWQIDDANNGYYGGLTKQRKRFYGTS